MKNYRLVEMNEDEGNDNVHLADVVEFNDGSVAVLWLGEHSSMVFWKSINDFKAVSMQSDKRELFEMN